MKKKARGFNCFCRCEGIGIDVSKACHEVSGVKGGQVWRTSVVNTEPELAKLAEALRAGGYRGKIICESTGHYHLLLGLVFARYGLDLRIINPLQSSKHQKARVRKTKTDRVDGYVLATMCLTERELPKAAHLEEKRVLMRLKQGQLQGLEKQIQGMSRSMLAYSETYEQLGLPGDESQALVRQGVDGLRKAKRRLQKELESLLVECAGDQMDALRPIPGFSPLVSGMVGSLFDREAKSDGSWVAYAGLDVSVRESGTWKGRGKLTKRGNSYIRKRLYGAAWGAVMNYAEVRQYYDALKAKGRNHVEALCIIARKLLRIAYAILVKGKTYDPNLAFPT